MKQGRLLVFWKENHFWPPFLSFLTDFYFFLTVHSFNCYCSSHFPQTQTDVLRNELQPGDEVAIKPGKSHLTYHGQHVPVTDMVYLAAGLGVVPVLDQIRAIAPRGASSVDTASVVWLNERRRDFDLAMDDLEAEYMKHPTKLAVSCVLLDAAEGETDAGHGPWEGHREVEEAVPYFDAGSMAVVCGPTRFAEGARGYLMRKGYPEDCICVLPL